MPKREKLALGVAVVSCVVAVVAALKVVGQVRLVDAIALFAGGFGAGAGLVGAVIRHRQRRGPAA